MKGRNGPLPPLLFMLTIVTGVVDAVSYLKLGHVFVANMTGNVVFLGFAAAGAAELSVAASLVAIASFLAGSLVGGRLDNRLGEHRGRLLGAATALKVVIVGAAAVASYAHFLPENELNYVLIVLVALAMGIQNATVRRLAVPDWTTTVLTMTLTGLAADSKLAGGTSPRRWPRILSVLAMLIGAFIGALLVIKVSVAAAFALASVLLAITGVLVYRLSREPGEWTAPAH